MATARCPCWARPGPWARCGPTAWFAVKWIWIRTRSASSPFAARSRPVSRRSLKWTTGCPTAASRTERPVRDVVALVGMRALFCSGCIGTYPLTDHRAHPGPAAVDQGRHAPAGQLGARRYEAGAPAQQVARAAGPHRGAQVTGAAVDDLDAQGGAAGGQLPSGDLVGGEQGARAAGQAEQGGAGALADAQGGQL